MVGKNSELKKTNILLVEDSPSDVAAARRALRESPLYVLRHAGTIREAEQALDEETFDLVLLDLGLPDDNGLNLLTKIRQTKNISVVIISSSDEVVDKIIGLEMGADDYITKPYEAKELNARIKAILRRTQDIQNKKSQSSPQQIYFSGWTLDSDRHQLYDENGASADITTAEFRLLEILAKSSQRVLSRDHLYSALYGTEYGPHDRALDIMIGRIRKKLGDTVDEPKFIKTIRGVGYMFCCDTEKLRKTA